MAVLSVGILTTTNNSTTLQASIAIYYAAIPSSNTAASLKDGYTAINTDLANLANDGWKIGSCAVAGGNLVWTLYR